MSHSCNKIFEQYFRFRFALYFIAHCTVEKITQVLSVSPLRLVGTRPLSPLLPVL